MDKPTYDSVFYASDLKAIPGPVSQLLSSYSGISPDEQIPHVIELRDRAYKRHPYPCLGSFLFLELGLSSHPIYHTEVLPLMTKTSEPPVFLDLGTCLGQDVRKLIFDISQSSTDSFSLKAISNIYGADLLPEFIDIGYLLFKDEYKLPRSQFITPANVLDDSLSNALSVLDGRVGILHLSAFFHLFDLEAQRNVVRRCLKLLNHEDLDSGIGEGRKRALICGAQTANLNPGHYPRRDGSMAWRHNGKTWKDMWETVVSEGDWKAVVRTIEVKSELVERRLNTPLPDPSSDVTEERKKMMKLMGEGLRWMIWSVWVEFV